MKKSYVKPMATNLAFALNENIATSGMDITGGHLKFNSEPGLNEQGTCNKYFGNTMIPSGLAPDVTEMSLVEFVLALTQIRIDQGDEGFAQLTGMNNPDTFEVAFACWAS